MVSEILGVKISIDTVAVKGVNFKEDLQPSGVVMYLNVVERETMKKWDAM